MTTILKLFLSFIFATICHWACMAFFGEVGITVNVMLIFSMVVCAYLKPEFGYPTAFLSGLFLDFFGVKLFGCNAFVFTLCACAVYGLEKRLDFDGVIPQIISIFFLTLGAGFLNLLLLKVFTGFSAWSGFWPFAAGITLNAVLTPFVFKILRRVFALEIKIS